MRLPVTSMSLLSLERLLRTVILPSCRYGLALYESQMKEGDFEYLDVVQGRLIKEGLVWGVKVLFHICAAGGDTVETGVRSCVLPHTIWGSDGLVRDWRGGHPIDTVC